MLDLRRPDWFIRLHDEWRYAGLNPELFYCEDIEETPIRVKLIFSHKENNIKFIITVMHEKYEIKSIKSVYYGD